MEYHISFHTGVILGTDIFVQMLTVYLVYNTHWEFYLDNQVKDYNQEVFHLYWGRQFRDERGNWSALP